MRNAFSIFLLIILVPATLGVILISSLHLNILSSAFVKEELSRQKVFVVAEHELEIRLAAAAFDPQSPLTGKDLSTLLGQVITPMWLEQNSNNIIDRAFGWFNTPDDAALSLPVDLREPKKALAQHLDTLIEEKISELPPCTKNSKGFCRMPGLDVSAFKLMLKKEGVDIDNGITKLPDSIDLLHPALPDISSSKDINDQLHGAQAALDEETRVIRDRLGEAKKVYQQALRYYRDMLIVYAGLILLYLCVNLKDRRRFVRWTSIFALAAGILPLCVGIASKPVMERYLLPRLPLDPSMPPGIQAIIIAVIHDVENALFTPAVFIGGGLVLAGIISIIVAHYIKLKEGV